MAKPLTSSIINPLETPVDLRAAYQATLPAAQPVVVGPVADAALPDAEAEFRARRRAALLGQTELEEKHGAAGTVARGLTRGVLDALLAPGALAGALAEGTGELTGWEGLKDFGRDLGESSTGAQALAAFGAAPKQALASFLTYGQAPELFGGDAAHAREALKSYEASVQETREEEQAWPMLSATSRLAGSVAFGLATGGLAGHASLAQQAIVGGVEGLGYGAQSAYEKNAPLRDVVTSSLIGGVLGGGLPVAVGKGVPYLQSKAASGLRDFAEKRAFKAGAGNYKRAYNEITRFGKEPERINRVGRKMLDRGIDLTDLDDMARGIGAEAQDGIARQGAVATSLDDAGVRVSTDEALAPVREQIAKLRSEGLGTFNAVADKLENEIAPFVQRTASPGRVFSEGVGQRLPKADLKFSEFWRLRQRVDDVINFEKAAKSPAEKSMRELRKHFDDALTKAVDGADPEIGKVWRAAKEDTADFLTMKEIVDELIQNREKNRFFGASDHGLGLGAFVGLMAGDVSGLTAAATGAAVSAANKLAREKGPGILARWADALAGHADDAGHVVSVSAAGGKEAQEAITTIAKARAAITEAAERAGDNPAAQQAARQAATQEVGEGLLKRAGAFDANWTKKPPTTLQKVIHRSEILDTVAADTSAAVQKVSALRPTLASPLAQRRLTKLLEDADGPAAIGGVQMRLANLMQGLPRSAEGEAMHAGLKAVSQQLQTAGKAETMRAAHDLVLKFGQAAQVAADPASKAFSARAAAELAGELAQPAWGTAGKHYATLAKAPEGVLVALSDPKAAREALRNVQLRGRLSGAVREGTESIRQAQTAAAELTGAKPTVSEADLKAMERLFEQAEEAVTLDGGPVNRVLDWFANKLEERVAGSLGAGVARKLGDQPGHVAGTAVAHAVKQRLSKVARVLHTAGHAGQHTGIHLAQSGASGAATGGTAETRAPRAAALAAAGVAAAAMAPRLLTPQEQQQRAKTRLDLLDEVAKAPDIEDGLAAVRAIAPGLDEVAVGDFNEKLTKLQRDIPRPKTSFRGPAFESMSSQDVRLSAAMWEATVDPLSVFDDFAGGMVDYDKIRYAQEQYPGLFDAARMGLQDVLFHQMDEDARAGVPEGLLTQLDMVFGLEGGLQETIAPGFVRTVDAIAADARSAQKPQARKPINLPTAQPTPMQRVAGHGR